MKRFWIFTLCIVLLATMTACGNNACTCECCNSQVNSMNTTQPEPSELQQSVAPTIEEIKAIVNDESDVQASKPVEDSCENPIGPSHYPFIRRYSFGNKGKYLVTTVKHGSKIDGGYNILGVHLGIKDMQGKSCYQTKEAAMKNPLEIEARGHEIQIIISYGDYTKTVTMKSGESELLSTKRISTSNDRCYLYVVVV